MKSTFLVSSCLPILICAATAFCSDQGCIDGTEAAARETDKRAWFIGGFCLNIYAIGAAYIIEPVPQETELLGKPPEYAAAYKDCYRMKGKEIRKNKAIGGCVTFGVLYASVYLLIVIALAGAG